MLNRILDTGDPSLFVLNNLDDSYFSEYKDEFNFILDHYRDYGVIPDKETFVAKFNTFDFIVVKETNKYLLDALAEDRNKRNLIETFNKIREKLNNDDTDGALGVFKQASDKMSEMISLESVDIFKDTSRYDAYVERRNDFSKYYVSTGFKELDKVLGGWDREEELATIIARTNQGKCLAKGTGVLMADGTVKKVESVAVGDKVQSLNSVNTVLCLHNGISNGYRIVPNIGDPFVVSSNHILTIATLIEKWDSLKRQYYTDGSFELKDITVEDYLSLSNHKKRLSRLYRPSIEYGRKDQKIPPYILGVWLGDGTSRELSITTMDSEIYDEWDNFAKSFGYSVSTHINGNRSSRSKLYTIVTGDSYRNKINNIFKEYDLFNNKHIPLEYLTGDREQRLELLAGIIDTDGSLSGSSYEITQKSFTLINQIAQLCRGLGLKVGKIQNKYSKRYDKNYYRILISGNINSVPCRLKRKVCKSVSHKQTDMIVTGFKIEPVESVEYYGFMCDGDSRYLLWDNTITHNTWMLLKCALAAAEQGLTVGLYSGEMSERKVGYRLDTLISHISNTCIIKGRTEVESDYKRYIDSLSSGKFKGTIKVLTPAMINGPAGVTALRAFIEKDHLDMLCVDQHSLLEDDRKAKNPVERASNISKDLKNLQVLKKIPIISVSQQNRSSTEDGITTMNIAQSDRIGQDSTVVLAFEQKDGVLNLQIIKARDAGAGKKLQYAINFDKGTFEYIPSESDAMGDEETKQATKSLKEEFDTGEVF